MKKLSFCLLILLSGCCPEPMEMPLTQLQIREIQTREFDTNNTKLVMKSMMDVLQDEGYIIKNAVMDLGLLSSEKNVDIEDKFHAFLCKMNDPNARWDKHQILEASANVSEFGSRTRVRMNFQMKIMDNYACPKEIKTIMDDYMYQDFFNKVSKGIFIQQENI